MLTFPALIGPGRGQASMRKLGRIDPAEQDSKVLQTNLRYCREQGGRILDPRLEHEQLGVCNRDNIATSRAFTRMLP